MGLGSSFPGKEEGRRGNFGRDWVRVSPGKRRVGEGISVGIGFEFPGGKRRIRGPLAARIGFEFPGESGGPGDDRETGLGSSFPGKPVRRGPLAVGIGCEFPGETGRSGLPGMPASGPWGRSLRAPLPRAGFPRNPDPGHRVSPGNCRSPSHANPAAGLGGFPGKATGGYPP